MRAILTEEEGARGAWALTSVAEPRPGPGELLVEVKAAGLNRADLQPAVGHHRGVAGAEMSGVVVEVGESSVGFEVGERVMALAPGCFADRITIDHRLAVPIPDSLGWVEAAALPAAYMTAHDALTRLGRIKPGMSVLVQGATSGVGVAALQLARFFGAGRLLGVARSAERLAIVAPLLDTAIVFDARWAEEVLAATDGQGAALIFDLIGASALPGHLSCAAQGGVILAVGRLGGAEAAIDLNQLALRRLTIIGTTFRSRTTDERAEVARAFAREVLPAVLDGRIKPIIQAVYPLADAAEARKRLAEGRQVGKIILDFS